jgi:hypothetical protein
VVKYRTAPGGVKPAPRRVQRVRHSLSRAGPYTDAQ